MKMFDGEPVAALAGDKVPLMMRIIKAGIKITDLEGAVEFWRDGTLLPTSSEGVVQLRDLMLELKQLME